MPNRAALNWSFPPTHAWAGIGFGVQPPVRTRGTTDDPPLDGRPAARLSLLPVVLRPPGCRTAVRRSGGEPRQGADRHLRPGLLRRGGRRAADRAGRCRAVRHRHRRSGHPARLSRLRCAAGAVRRRVHRDEPLCAQRRSLLRVRRPGPRPYPRRRHGLSGDALVQPGRPRGRRRVRLLRLDDPERSHRCGTALVAAVDPLCTGHRGTGLATGHPEREGAGGGAGPGGAGAAGDGCRGAGGPGYRRPGPHVLRPVGAGLLRRHGGDVRPGHRRVHGLRGDRDLRRGGARPGTHGAPRHLRRHRLPGAVLRRRGVDPDGQLRHGRVGVDGPVLGRPAAHVPRGRPVRRSVARRLHARTDRGQRVRRHPRLPQRRGPLPLRPGPRGSAAAPAGPGVPGRAHR